MKKILLLMFMVVSCVTGLLAQRTVNGVVTDTGGEPLIGASVVVAQNTQLGTVTDFDGNFTLEVPEDVTSLEVTYTGYGTKLVDVSSTDYVTVQLSEGEELKEVVVTALGVKRDKKALGYSVTQIDKKQFQLQGESDPARILSGKVAGVNVLPQGGFLGGGTSVIVRSKGSITGSNQPLYIVDGSPFTGNISDIDPANIESTSVLKGLTASVLYGQQGRNGVIVITTKNGIANDEVQTNISLTQSVVSNQVSNLPEFQNTYGNGADNATFIGYYGTWGAAFDPNVQVPHYYSTGRHPAHSLFPEYANQTVPYVASEDNVSKFFGNGLGSNTSLNVSTSKDGRTINFNLGYDNQKGYIDENTYEKVNAGIGMNQKVNDKLNVGGSFQFTRINTETPNRGFFNILTYIPRNFPIFELPYESPVDKSNVYYRAGIENPRWVLANQRYNEERDRIFATGNINYKLTDKLGLSYQAGLNMLTNFNQGYSNKGGVDGDNLIGWLSSSNRKEQVLDQNLKLSIGTTQLSEKFGVSGLVGLNYRNDRVEGDGLYSTEQISYGFINHSNFKTHAMGGDYRTSVNTLGLYGQVDFSFENWLYLSVSGRNDWSSALEKGNNSIFYPSFSLSSVLSDKFNFGSNVDFLKFRAGYATSAGFPSPYLTRNVLNTTGTLLINPAGPYSAQSISGFKANPDLKPELAKEYEIGADLKMFGSRVGLDATYFHRINEDQLLNTTLPVSSGKTSTIINAGRIDTWGTELGLTLVPVRSGDFEWEVYTTFTAIENEVKDLPEDRLPIYSNINWAEKGQPLGVFRGTYFMKDDNGNLLVDQATGKLITSESLGKEFAIIGDPNEDWRGSMINTFRYKGFELAAQFEVVSGGDIYSVTAQNLLRRGVTIDTEDREGTYVIPGVLSDAEGNIQLDEAGNAVANTIQLGANDIYFLNTQDTAESRIYDATTFRLRQARLSYRLADNLLGKLPFSNAVVSVSGSNLWYETPNMPKGLNIDPEVNTAVSSNGDSSAIGIDFQSDPAYKKWTFSLKLNF